MTISFIEHFNKIEDKRINRCKRHELLDIIFLSVVAVLSGAQGWEDIQDFGKLKLDWLRQFMPFSNGIPSHDTVRRVLNIIETEQFHSAFMLWINSTIQSINGDIIAIDGKTARSSFKNKEGKNALHVVSAWSNCNQVVLGQQKVAGKSNEITAIPTLLDLLDIANTIVTIDAMGCQKEIAKKITAKNADYVLALKGNQGNLQKEIEAWLHKAEREQFHDVIFDSKEDIDAGHGRIEIRRCLHAALDLDWIEGGAQWPNLRSIIQINSEVHEKDKITTETRYYISSLDVNATEALSAVRAHWGVESMHWMLDMTFREDESRIRMDNGPEIFNGLRKIALNMVKLDQTVKASMKRKLKMAALDDNYRKALIEQTIKMR